MKQMPDSSKLRTLVVGERPYLWRVRHRHEIDEPLAARRCVEVFSAFTTDSRRGALRIRFPASSQQGSTYPEHAGGVVDYREPSWYLNLNRPAVARMLIEIANALGWPSSSQGKRREHTIPDGYALVREHREHLERLLASDATQAETS